MKTPEEMTIQILEAIGYPVETVETNKNFFARQRIENIIKERDKEFLQIRFCDLYDNIIKE